MTNFTNGFTRRGVLGAFAACTVAAAPVMAKASGLIRNAGDVRRLSMTNPRTGESIDTVYWADGRYINDSLREIATFMRDWRNGKVITIDKRTIDIMAAAHGLMDVSEPYTLLSGYRSPETNAMLRRTHRGVARNSRHMKGEAADLRLASRSVNQIYRAARTCNGGGVGKYSRSNFVHMDCGPIRTWGS